MIYTNTITISEKRAKAINKILTVEPLDVDGCFGEDFTITNTAVFPNGIEVDVKCCGVQYREGESNLGWTEAVLFKDGAEVCHTEPSDSYLGKWELEYNGDTYVVTVLVG